MSGKGRRSKRPQVVAEVISECPPLFSTSSDMGLVEAVEAVARQGNLSESGIVVTFSPQSLVAQLEDKPELCAKMQVK